MGRGDFPKTRFIWEHDMAETFTDWKNKGKKRPIQHIIGESGVDILKGIMPSEWVIREYQPDYGIDLDVELFEEMEDGGFITKGEHVLFQVKGVENLKRGTKTIYHRTNVEKENKVDKTSFYTMDVVKYSLETQLLELVEKMGTAVPVMLAVVDTTNKEAYCVCLNDYIEKVLLPDGDYSKQNTVTINIPVENCINDDFGKKLIEWYGKRAKLVAFFNKIHYQRHEIQYMLFTDNYLEKIDFFLKKLRRLDVWSVADYYPAFKMIKDDVDYYTEHHCIQPLYENLQKRVAEGKDIDKKEYSMDVFKEGLYSLRETFAMQSVEMLWEKLSTLAGVFEEDAKEWYLPTYYHCMIKE